MVSARHSSIQPLPLLFTSQLSASGAGEALARVVTVCASVLSTEPVVINKSLFCAAAANAEELERRKQVWQEELDAMSEFLVIKSTEEQRDEGVEKLVDTAFVGELILRPLHIRCSPGL